MHCLISTHLLSFNLIKCYGLKQKQTSWPTGSATWAGPSQPLWLGWVWLPSPPVQDEWSSVLPREKGCQQGPLQCPLLCSDPGPWATFSILLGQEPTRRRISNESFSLKLGELVASLVLGMTWCLHVHTITNHLTDEATEAQKGWRAMEAEDIFPQSSVYFVVNTSRPLWEPLRSELPGCLASSSVE